MALSCQCGSDLKRDQEVDGRLGRPSIDGAGVSSAVTRVQVDELGQCRRGEGCDQQEGEKQGKGVYAKKAGHGRATAKKPLLRCLLRCHATTFLYMLLLHSKPRPALDFEPFDPRSTPLCIGR